MKLQKFDRPFIFFNEWVTEQFRVDLPGLLFSGAHPGIRSSDTNIVKSAINVNKTLIISEGKKALFSNHFKEFLREVFVVSLFVAHISEDLSQGLFIVLGNKLL